MHGFAVIAGAVSVTIWLYLLVAHGRFWMVQRLEADVVPPPETGLIAVIIPARNEAEFIANPVTSLLSVLWALTLPVSAVFYMWATLHSALKYWSGRGGEWKGRAQDVVGRGQS